MCNVNGWPMAFIYYYKIYIKRFTIMVFLWYVKIYGNNKMKKDYLNRIILKQLVIKLDNKNEKYIV